MVDWDEAEQEFVQGLNNQRRSYKSSILQFLVFLLLIYGFYVSGYKSVAVLAVYLAVGWKIMVHNPEKESIDIGFLLGVLFYPVFLVYGVLKGLRKG